MSWTIPQQQESQNAPADLQERLFDEVRTLSGVDVGASRISVPGARGFTLRAGSDDEQACTQGCGQQPGEQAGYPAGPAGGPSVP